MLLLSIPRETACHIAWSYLLHSMTATNFLRLSIVQVSKWSQRKYLTMRRSRITSMKKIKRMKLGHSIGLSKTTSHRMKRPSPRPPTRHSEIRQTHQNSLSTNGKRSKKTTIKDLDIAGSAFAVE